MGKFVRALLFSGVLVIGLCGSAATTSKSAAKSDDFAEFQAFVESTGEGSGRLQDAERATRVGETFDRMFGALVQNDNFADLPDDELVLIFKASGLANSYDGSPRRAEQLLKLTLEKKRRNLSEANDMSIAFNSLLRARLFVSAGVLRNSQPELANEVLPDVIERHEGASPSWYERGEDAEGGTPVLTRRAANIERGSKIIVVAHPRCHFTLGAATAIAAEPALSRIFASHSDWIMPPTRGLELAALQEWDDEFPVFSIKLAHSLEDWSLIDGWDTPRFYFLRDGKIVDTVIGWPKEGRMNELKAAVTRLNVD